MIFEVEVTCRLAQGIEVKDLHIEDQEERPWETEFMDSRKWVVNADDKEAAHERALDNFHSTVPVKVLDDFDISVFVYPVKRELVIHDVDAFAEAIKFALDTKDTAEFVRLFHMAIIQRGTMDKISMSPDGNENKSFTFCSHSSFDKERVDSHNYNVDCDMRDGKVEFEEACKLKKRLHTYIMGLELHGTGKDMSVSLSGKKGMYYGIHT